MVYATALSCILVAMFKLINSQQLRLGNGSRWRMYEHRISASSPTLTDCSTDFSFRRAKQNGIMRQIQRVFSLVKMQYRDNPESDDLQTSSVSSSISTYRFPMPVEDAEAIVKQWQAIKAEALGLDGPMLAQVVSFHDCGEEVYFNLSSLCHMLLLTSGQWFCSSGKL